MLIATVLAWTICCPFARADDDKKPAVAGSQPDGKPDPKSDIPKPIPKADMPKKVGAAPPLSSPQELLAQKSRATCDTLQDHLRDLDNKTLENIGAIENLNLNDKISVENSRKQFGDSIEARRRSVLQVDTCERLHSQILNYYNNQDVSAFLQERISNLLISDLGIGRLKSPESEAVLAFLFDLKIELKSSTLSGLAIWEFVAERLKEFSFGIIHNEDQVQRVLESAYSDDVKGQAAANVSLEEAGDYVDAKFSDRTNPVGTTKVFRSDSHDPLELRP